jgi:sialate O-acetylesterase
MHRNKLFILVSLCFFSVSAVANADQKLKLAAPFTNNMILQRQTQAPVWGWSKPGARVTVEFAGQKKSATAGKDGKWMLKLDALEASFEPREMVVSDNEGKSVTLKNILVGEVWLASGQSNMQWTVAKSSSSLLKVEPVGEGKVAPIREFEVTSVVAMLHPIEKADGAWKNGDYGNYSAIAFAFAHKLYGELKVPIGILNCSFSQTAIQAWVPRVGFRDSKDEYTQAIYQKILETDPTTSEHKVAWDSFYQSIEKTLKENADRVSKGQAPRAISTKTPGNMNGNRDASWLFNGRLNPVVPYAIRGGIWNQGYANMGEGLPYYNNLHSLVRGWRMVWGRPELPVYFNQFYCPGQKGEWNNSPSIAGTAEMRLGTWLARDIPNTGMASQIDITGSIHYFNKAVPGQRLTLHALKNQYGRKVVADGPMFKSYRVERDKLIVEFDHADGGLVVAETRTNTDRSNKDRTGLADPKMIENGADQVKLFYIADENRVWYPAKAEIADDKVVLTSPKVQSPCGVSYGTGGIGFQPNLCNRSLLPMTPFIYYDNKLVTSKTWPDEKLKVDGEVIDPSTVGKLYEWRKMPLLSTQFRDNAVLQAGMPITIWGSVLHDYGYEAEGEAVIKFSFAGIEKTIPVNDDSPNIVEIAPGDSRYSGSAKEWRVTVPPMKASAEPKTLKVTFLIDGEVAHERVCENIVIGDVWFVAAPPGKFDMPSEGKSDAPVRMMTRKAKRFTSPRPSRYTVCVSRTPLNRFASEWTEATGLAAALGDRIASKTGKPVGIIFMQSGMTSMGKGMPSKNLADVKSWIHVKDLKHAPSLMDDYKDLAAVLPGNRFYDANARRYVASWKQYWNEYIPQMTASKAVPDGVAWGSYPTLSSSVTSKASEAYNVLVHSFTPAGLNEIIFLASPEMFEKDLGTNYGKQLSVLANSWKARFAGEDLQFVYTIPSKSLAPKITRPTAIKGQSMGVEITDWSDIAKLIEAVVK